MTNEPIASRSMDEIIAEANAALGIEEPKPLWEWTSPKERLIVMLSPLPEVVIGSPQSLRIVFGLGLLFKLGFHSFLGYLIWNMRETLAAKPYWESIRLTDLSGTVEASPVLFSLSFALLLLLSTLIHEFGHGIGYVLTGRRVEVLALSFDGASVTGPMASNSYRQLFAVILGGGLQAAAGFAVLAVLGGPGWTLLQIAAMLSILIGLTNLFIPLNENSDGTKFWVHLSRIVIGRGGKPLSMEAEQSTTDHTQDPLTIEKE